jgi:hypothetical protein
LVKRSGGFGAVAVAATRLDTQPVGDYPAAPTRIDSVYLSC